MAFGWKRLIPLSLIVFHHVVVARGVRKHAMANLLSRAFDGLNQVRRGLATVFGHTFKEPITKEYPDEDVPISGTVTSVADWL
jgi:hypothetical protein